MNMAEIESITLHLGDPFAGVDLEGVDEERSQQRYIEMLQAALEEAFPRVTLYADWRTIGGGRTIINSSSLQYGDDEEARERIDQILEALHDAQEFWVFDEPSENQEHD